MKTILFQGDSITDARRDRNDGEYNGMGYATMCAAELGVSYPGQYTFINRGIGGNRTTDLYARWKVDCINLKPDFLSIMIGVNDVWHELNFNNGVSEKRFKNIYSFLIEDTLEALPDIKIMLLEPFLLKHTATEEKWDIFMEAVERRAQIVREIAANFSLPCISLQCVFESALKEAPVSQWTVDGVHPSAAGHRLIANEWIKTFEKISNLIRK